MGPAAKPRRVSELRLVGGFQDVGTGLACFCGSAVRHRQQHLMLPFIVEPPTCRISRLDHAQVKNIVLLMLG